MKVIRARVLGFCMGVKRAVEMASEEVKRSSENGKPVFTLGPLIHNPKVLADLKAQGVKILNENCDNQSLECNSASNMQFFEGSISDYTIIIRAHGISPSTEKDLQQNGWRIVDATCPKVKSNQIKVRELSCAGFHLFLAGEAGKQGFIHAEIAGLLGYGESASFCTVVCNAKEGKEAAANLKKNKKDAKTALLGQTTISEEEYTCIALEIKKYFPDLKIEKTICNAAAERRKALRELLPSVDALVIAGSSESANTRRLFEIAKESGKPCILAEDASEIPPDFYKYKTVGLCAGASAPDSVINEIEQKLLK